MRIALILSLILLASCTTGTYTILSPDKSLRVEVVLPGTEKENSLRFNLYKNDSLISGENYLGLKLNSANSEFHKNLRLLSFRQFYIDNLFSQDESKPQRNRANGIKFMLANTEGKNMDVVFRVYNDGVAYKYELFNDSLDEMADEFSSFSFPEGTQLASSDSLHVTTAWGASCNLIVSTTTNSVMAHPNFGLNARTIRLFNSQESTPSLPPNYHTPWRFIHLNNKESDANQFADKLLASAEFAY